MAYATTPVDTYRGSNSITLPPELSQQVWSSAVEESAVMQLAQRVELVGRGVSVPVVTGDASANWVNEAAEKNVSNPTFALKNMTPYKLAVIELFSDEFRRDLPALYNELARRLPYAIAKKFDNTVFQGVSVGSGFDVLTGAATYSIDPDASENMYQKLVGIIAALGANGYELNGIAASAQGQAALLGAVDGQGRPLFLTDITAGNGVGRVLGARVVKASQTYDADNSIVAIAGDWSQARYGIVDGINISISDQATINDGTNQINLWQRNMFALRCECEISFVCKSTDAFRRLTATVRGATGATA